MDDSDLAVTAGPEVVDAPDAEQTEGQDTQTAEASTEVETEEKKSETAKRREREKAFKAELRSQAADAQAKADAADARRIKIIDAGKSEASPVETDFADYADYIAAKAVWSAEKRTIQRHADELSSEADDARKQADAAKAKEWEVVESQWIEKVQEAKTRYSDFETVVRGQVAISPHMAELIKTSDLGADMAYHLGTHRDIAAKIYSMNREDAAYVMGRLEGSLTKPQPRITSNAPEPVSPVKGTAKASRDPNKMSFKDFKAFRESD